MSDEASMGPGSFDPGSEYDAGYEGGGNPGFNGAGVFRPRKSEQPALSACYERMLQWGRGLSTPEVRCPP